MVSLTPYQQKIKKARASKASDNPHYDFLEELRLAGFKPPQVLPENTITRMDSPNDKKGKHSGWAIYKPYDNCAIGIYGSWNGEPEKVVWSSKPTHTMSFSERATFNKQLKEAEEHRKTELEQAQTKAAQTAFEKWQALPDANDAPYLIKKKVKAHDGVKQSGENLIVPVSVEGQITSLQTIRPDGSKKFMAGGRVKGCCFIIDGSTDAIYITEGYATAASVHELTSAKVYTAFSAGNLYETTQLVVNEHPQAKIVLAGENNDTFRNKAVQIEAAFTVRSVFPPEKYDDFNDLFVAEGAESAKAVLVNQPKVYKNQPKKKEALQGFQFGGAIRDIINYYNATSGNEQPLFAIQTALSTCSIILGRNFETNYSNRSSMFFMNIAKSGTGKEHAKRVVEKILDATANSELVAGDGYTSGTAVISALQERPRHVTIIDEFSKYLQAAQNKYGSSHLMEANAQLMQAIARLDGTMRARSYAAIGLTKEKKKELANQFVVNPAVTLLAMTTPDDLFNTIDVSSVKDGFLNRFVICISDAERTLREHKEPVDVPQSIIDWCEKIQTNIPAVESPIDAPTLTRLTFDVDAVNLQRSFQKYCIEQANDLDAFGMDEIPNRSNEMAMRLALIIALSDDPYTKTIKHEHMRQAIDWIKFNLDRLIKKLKMSVSSSEHEGHKKEILQSLRDRGERGCTWSQMQKQAPFSKHKQKDLKEILQALKDANLIIDEPTKGRGRPTILWSAIDE